MKRCIGISLIASFLIVGSLQAEERICARTSLAPDRKGKIHLDKAVVGSAAACKKGYKQIFTQRTPSELISALVDVDGTGSGLDAEKFNGQTSAFYAPQSGLDTTNAAVQALTSRTGVLETTAQNLNTDVDVLQSETRIQNIVRVATAGGDYTSLSEAINTLASPGVDNPYLITMGPGIYTISAQVTVPTGVRIQGSGMDQTILQGTISSSDIAISSIVILSSGAKLSDLSVRNVDVSGVNSTGIVVPGTIVSAVDNLAEYPTSIERVKVLVTGGSVQGATGVVVFTSDFRIIDSAISVEGTGIGAVGIFHLATSGNHSTHVDGTTIFATGGAGGAYGVVSQNAGGTGAVTVIASRIYALNAALRTVNGIIRVSGSMLTSPGIGMLSQGGGGAIAASHLTIEATTYAVPDSGGQVTCSYLADDTGTALTGCG